jgi:hypothetical protein
MALPQFVDKHPTYSASGFTVTNEEPELHRALLRGRRFNSTACIASGGEIMFFILINRSKELTAVDHSYRALAACWLKALCLDQFGPRETKRLFSEITYKEFVAKAEKLADGFPDALKKHFNLWPGALTQVTINVSEFESMRREWFYADERVLAKSCRNMGRVTLMHGDLRDLDKEYDLLYVSNAMEHSGRDRKYPRADDLAKFVRPKGFMLVTGGYMQTPAEPSKAGLGYPIKSEKPKEWTVAKTVKGFRTTWSHHLLVKMPPMPDKTVAEVVAQAPAIGHTIVNTTSTSNAAISAGGI